MRSVNTKIYALAAIIGLIMTFDSCNKTKDPGPAIVKFSIKNATKSESDGTATVDVTLSNKQSKEVKIAFTWTGSATTYLNGDFSLTTDTLTIPAGQTIGHFQVAIIDDTQIDDDDDLTLTIASTSTNAKLSTTSTDLNFDLTITNNDAIPSNGLQMDLTWDQGLGSDIDNVDLDLYLESNVTLDGSGVPMSGTDFATSTNSSGFETVVLDASDPDQAYYIIVPYSTGTGAVNFTITLNGFEYSAEQLSGTFPANQAPSGSNVYFEFSGPYNKSSNTFPHGRLLATAKPTLHAGSILKINAGEFLKKKKK